jgi:hypothetical protein
MEQEPTFGKLLTILDLPLSEMPRMEANRPQFPIHFLSNRECPNLLLLVQKKGKEGLSKSIEREIFKVLLEGLVEVPKTGGLLEVSGIPNSLTVPTANNILSFKKLIPSEKGKWSTVSFSQRTVENTTIYRAVTSIDFVKQSVYNNTNVTLEV